MKQKQVDKYRPYLSKDELLLLLSLTTEHRNKLLSDGEMEVTLSARKILGKIALSIDSGIIPSYTTSQDVRDTRSLADKLGLTQEDLCGSKRELTDNEKLEAMSVSQKLQHWIDFNREQFSIEPTNKQLLELDTAKLLEYNTANQQELLR